MLGVVYWYKKNQDRQEYGAKSGSQMFGRADGRGGREIVNRAPKGDDRI